MKSENVPESIKEYIKNKPYVAETIGMSSSEIYMFDDMVLKISADITETENEATIYRYLSGKLPVPKVIAYETACGKSFLLSSRIKGKMLCDESFLAEPDKLVSLAAEGLKMLWNVDCTGFPYGGSLDAKLLQAKDNIEKGRITADDFDDKVRARFSTPERLWDWLSDNRPDEVFLFSHGDYCLPNIFADSGKISGFIDLGCAGVCDRYQDIALCYRSIEQNFSGHYRDGKNPIDYDVSKLFDKLGIEPDYEKMQYYLYLDTLF